MAKSNNTNISICGVKAYEMTMNKKIIIIIIKLCKSL